MTQHASFASLPSDWLANGFDAGFFCVGGSSGEQRVCLQRAASDGVRGQRGRRGTAPRRLQPRRVRRRRPSHTSPSAEVVAMPLTTATSPETPGPTHAAAAHLSCRAAGRRTATPGTPSPRRTVEGTPTPTSTVCAPPRQRPTPAAARRTTPAHGRQHPDEHAATAAPARRAPPTPAATPPDGDPRRCRPKSTCSC